MRPSLMLALAVYLSVATLTNGQTTQLGQSAEVDPTSTDAKPSGKKVWTNGDLNDLPANSEASVSSPRHQKKPYVVSNQSGQQTDRQKGPLAKNYHDRIARLQTEVAKLDPQIAALQAAVDGNQVDQPRKYGWQSPASYPDELAQLQGKRGDLLDQISALEDEARHKGVPPNGLP